MPRLLDSEYFDKSYARFGIPNISETTEIKTTSFRKKKVSAAILLFLTFLTFLVILYFFKHNIPPKAPKTRKTKRHLKMETFTKDKNNKMLTQNVQIVPETLHLDFINSKCVSSHSDDRYIKEKPQSRGQEITIKQLQERKEWSYKPFESKAQKVVGGDSQEIQLGQKVEKKVKLTNALRKGSVLSMRLKGIYMQPVIKKSNKLNDKFGFSKEINNLIHRQYASNVKGERTQKKEFKSQGAPFKLPGKENQKVLKAEKPFLSNESPRRRPLTMYLDFYPMEEVEDSFKQKKITQTKNKLPYGKENSMTMKLILYPKELQEKIFRTHARGPLLKYNKKADGKSLKWFSDHKKRDKSPEKIFRYGTQPSRKTYPCEGERRRWRLDLCKASGSEIFERRKKLKKRRKSFQQNQKN